MRLPFIPPTIESDGRVLAALALLLVAFVPARAADDVLVSKSSIAWKQGSARCPALLSGPREFLAMRESGEVSFDLGGVDLPATGPASIMGQALLVEVRPRGDGWTLKLSNEGCTASGNVEGAEALESKERTAYLERKAVLRKAQSELDAMQRAVGDGDLRKALELSASACERRRQVLGEIHPLVAHCDLLRSRRARALGLYEDTLRLSKSAYGSLSSGPYGKRSVDALAARSAEGGALFYLSRPMEMNAVVTEVWQGRRELLGPSHPDTLASQGDVGISLQRLGRLDEAVEIYEDIVKRQVAASGATSEPSLLAKLNLSSALQQRGEFDRAVVLQQEIYETRKSSSGVTHPSTLVATHDLGQLLADAGRTEEAIALVEQALPEFPARFGDTHPQTLRIKMLLASLYNLQGRNDEALPLFREVYAANLKTGGAAHRSTVIAAQNLADTLMNLERGDEALTLLEVELRALRAASPRDNASERLIEQIRAFAFLRTGEPARALEVFEGILGTRYMTPSQVGKATMDQLRELAGWAQALSELGRSSDAIGAMEAMNEGCRGRFGPDHPITLEVVATLAHMNTIAGRRDRAMELMAEFVARNEQRVEDGVVANSANRGRVTQGVRDRPHIAGYRTYVRLLAGDNPVRAFEVAELTKARSLSESLSRPGLENAAVREARARYAKAEERVALTEVGTTPYLHAVAERSNAEMQLRTAMGRRVRAAAPDLRDSLKQALPPGAVFVHFIVSGDQVLALTADNRALVAATDLGTIPGLADTIESYRRYITSSAPASERIWTLADGRAIWSLSKPDGAVRHRDPGQIGADLSRRLLEPLMGKIGGAKQWIISPDGPLAFLPFEALPFGKQMPLDAHGVRYAPSLAAISGTPALVMTRTRLDFLGIGISRFPAGDRLSWHDLPRAEMEARNIGEIFPAATRLVLAGAEASETRFRSLEDSGDLRRYRYLHFATHAFLSPRGASLSGVVLSGAEAGKSDGVITAAEWSTYHLRSDLVVFSACDTGLGRLVAGEGVVGLPNALLTAGARSVILTLWSVADESAAEFMPRFYKRLKAGKAPAEALRETKLEFARSKGPYSSPRHWAPYVLYGAP